METNRMLGKSGSRHSVGSGGVLLLLLTLVMGLMLPGEAAAKIRTITLTDASALPDPTGHDIYAGDTGIVVDRFHVTTDPSGNTNWFNAIIVTTTGTAKIARVSIWDINVIPNTEKGSQTVPGAGGDPDSWSVITGTIGNNPIGDFEIRIDVKSDATPGTLTARASGFYSDNDPLGNGGSTDVAGSGAFTIQADTIPPTVTVTTFPTVNNANKAAVTLSGACENGSGTVSLAITDAGAAHTVNATPSCSAGSWTASSLDLSSLNDGTLTATASQTDAAGNTGTGSNTAMKDVVPPTAITVTTFPTVNNANKTAVTLSGECENGLSISLAITDAGAAHTVNATPSCSAGSWTASSLDLSSLNDGALTATASQTDAAGNTASGSKTSTKDVVPPTTTPSVAGGSYTSAQDITFNCDDGTGGGCDKTYYCTGTACDPTTEFNIATPIHLDGPAILRYYSVDKAGNSETVKTTGYTICTVVLAPTSVIMPANADLGTFDVQVQTGCAWTASTTDSWLNIFSGAGGSGNGTVKFSVATHSGATTRSGKITVTAVDATDFNITQKEMPLTASFIGVVNGVGYESPFGPPTLDLIFDASGTRGPNPITNYNWDFGDATTADTATATIAHSYAVTGSYMVTLTVTDGTQTDVTQRIVTVADVVTNVSTANALQAALTAAQNNGGHDLIRVAQGTYNLSDNSGSHFAYIAAAGEDKDLVIEGGWTADFSMRGYNVPTTINNDATAATADGGVLYLDGSAGAGDISVDGLIITGGNTSGKGGGLYAKGGGKVITSNSRISGNTGGSGGAYLESTGDIWFVSNIVTSNTGSADAGGAVIAATGSTYVYANEVTGNTGGTDGGLTVQSGDGAEMVISNNTITGNTGTSASGGLTANNAGSGVNIININVKIISAGFMDIHNNIIKGNTGTSDLVVTPDCDALISSIDLNVIANDLGTYDICADYPLDAGNINVAPYFMTNSTGDIKLRASDTQLIDRGTNYNTPAEDIEGDVIPINGGTSLTSDIGADEYNPLNPGATMITITPANPVILTLTGNVVLTITLDHPAKKDTVFAITNSDNTVISVPAYVKILDGQTQVQITAQAVGIAGTSVITATDPSGMLIPDSLSVSVALVPTMTLTPSGGHMVFVAPLNGISKPQTVTVTNTGVVPLTLSGIVLSGKYADQFAQTNDCPIPIAPGASCSIIITFHPTYMVTNGVPMNVTLLVNAASGNSGSIQLKGYYDYDLSPTALSFSAPVGTSSGEQDVTVKNTSGTELFITSVSFWGESPSQFTQTNDCGASLLPDVTCTVHVKFVPTVYSALPVKATLYFEAWSSIIPADPKKVYLTGQTGTMEYGAAPSSLSFSSPVNFQTSAQTVTITNTGSLPLTINGISLGGANPLQFAQSNDCGGSVAAGATCTVNVTFKPTWLNTVPMRAVLNIDTAMPATSSSVALTGTFDYVVTPSSVSFHSPMNVQTGVKNVTVVNTTAAPIGINSIALGGTNPLQFAQNNNCPATLAVGASCVISVTFKPTWLNAVPMKATLDVNTSAPVVSKTVPVTGTIDVFDFTVGPASLSFHSTMNVRTSAQTVTVTNTGASALAISSIEVAGTNLLQFAQTNNCPATLAVGASCTANVTFRPTWINGVPMKATLNVNAGGITKTTALSGTIDLITYTVTPSSLSFSSPMNVQTSAQTVTVTNNGNQAITINSVAVGGTNVLQFAQTNNCPATLAVGASCTANVTFRPTWLNTVDMKATLDINVAAPAISSSVRLTGAIQ